MNSQEMAKLGYKIIEKEHSRGIKMIKDAVLETEFRDMSVLRIAGLTEYQEGSLLAALYLLCSVKGEIDSQGRIKDLSPVEVSDLFHVIDLLVVDIVDSAKKTQKISPKEAAKHLFKALEFAPNEQRIREAYQEACLLAGDKQAFFRSIKRDAIFFMQQKKAEIGSEKLLELDGEKLAKISALLDFSMHSGVFISNFEQAVVCLKFNDKNLEKLQEVLGTIRSLGMTYSF